MGLLVIGLVLGSTTGIAGGAKSVKKKTAKAKPFAASLAPGAGIPDAVGGTRSVPVRSTLTVGKAYKGKVVGDVNVTGIQTTGSAANAASDLVASLTAPSGRTVVLFRFQGNQSLGPWTLDDDTPVSTCDVDLPTLCPSPLRSLNRPFAGTSNLAYNDNPALTPLQGFDGAPMRGTWTFTIADLGATRTSVLNTWGLRITPAKPVKP